METSTLPAFMKHLNDYVRIFVPKDTHYVVPLDGHGSWNGIEWLEFCEENKIEVVVSPANTSNFLQPQAQGLGSNGEYKTAMRHIRDDFNKSHIVPTRSVQFNLICGVHAYKSITPTDISQSFSKTGLFPYGNSPVPSLKMQTFVEDFFVNAFRRLLPSFLDQWHMRATNP